MLVFISDLHLMDGTAGKHHLDWHDFKEVYSDIALYAKKSRAKELKIVLLGDIFDLVRTERWFDFELNQRPWGNTPSEEAALTILNGVIEQNQKTCDILSGKDTEFDFSIEPELYYIPGNHDRLCNQYPSMRRQVIKALGLKNNDPAIPFEHSFLSEDYGAFARHGHEWDPFNFEKSEDFRYEKETEIPYSDYMNTPIGDVLASEIASKLPLVVRNYLSGHPEQMQIYNNFRNLFDVRPLAAVIPWLSFQVKNYDHSTRRLINQAVQEVMSEFRDISFVKRWIAKHDSWWDPFDKGDRIQLLSLMVEAYEFTDFDRELQLIEQVMNWWRGDNYASQAAQDFRRLHQNSKLKHPIFYVLYGHTHKPDQQAVDVIQHMGKEFGRAYLNTGTWRPTYRQGITKQGFMEWKNLTYTIIYKPGEMGSDGLLIKHPVFQTKTSTWKVF